jgi:hypothetical protein
MRGSIEILARQCDLAEARTHQVPESAIRAGVMREALDFV